MRLYIYLLKSSEFWKTMQNEKIKSRPEKVMENEHFTKSHGEVMEFRLFINVDCSTFEKNMLITFSFDTQ